MVLTPAKTHGYTHSDGSRSSGGGPRVAKPTKGLGLITAHACQTEKYKNGKMSRSTTEQMGNQGDAQSRNVQNGKEC